MTEQQIDDFMGDLMDLCRKHGVTIAGCGCCGSPFVHSSDQSPKCGPMILEELFATSDLVTAKDESQYYRASRKDSPNDRA